MAHVRNAARLKRGEGGLHLELFQAGVDVDEAVFVHSRDTVDIVLIELVAAAKFLVQSPFVSELERVIGMELAQSAIPSGSSAKGNSMT